MIDLFNEYTKQLLERSEWAKWRVCYEGGEYFRETYLKKINERETDSEFEARKIMTPIYTPAQTGIDEIRDNAVEHFHRIERIGGSAKYHQAIKGEGKGIDGMGNSMDYFLARDILPELLVMRKVGIFVDMPIIGNPTKAVASSYTPYVYIYHRECIEDYAEDPTLLYGGVSSVVLVDYVDVIDPETGLKTGYEKIRRHLYVGEDGAVYEKRIKSNESGKDVTPIRLDITVIPFFIADLGVSLMKSVADLQIAILNLSSSDIAQTLSANFPLYLEQVDTTGFNPYAAKTEDADGVQEATKIKTGPKTGRMYGKNLDAPSYLSYPVESLQVSMDKQQQCERQIRTQLHLTLSHVTAPRGASAESKKLEGRGLETGLSNLALTLQAIESNVADLFAMYTGTEAAEVIYPRVFQLLTDQERITIAEDLLTLTDKMPSRSAQNDLIKQAVDMLLGNRLTRTELQTIHTEIEKAPIALVDTEKVIQMLEIGNVDMESVAASKGYPKDTVEKAAKEHEERATRIAMAQSKATYQPDQQEDPGARGNKDMDPTKQGAKNEKNKVKEAKRI